MHVVILAEFAVASGGAEKVAVESARGLADAGLDVTFIQAIDGPADPLLDHPRLRRVTLGLTDIWNLPLHRGAVTGIWHGQAATRLRAAFDGLPKAPDCIHLHQWTRALSPAVMPVLFGRGVPVALTLHEYFLACPNGLYYRFDQGEPCALKPLSAACLSAACDPKSRLHKAVRVGRSVAMRSAVRRGGRERSLDVIHVSDASRTRLGGMLAGWPVHHHRIDNPVRVENREPAEPAQGDSVVYVGRLTEEKGADLFAAAAERAGVKALIVGAGPLEAELRSKPGVELLGWRSPAELAAVVRQRARAVCAPSRWFETGPLTVYEALAQGIPVVASARAGASEKVVDGQTGFVVEPTIAALSEAFERLTDHAAVHRMGQAAHAAYWARPMSLHAHAAALASLYEKIIARSGPEKSESQSETAESVKRVHGYA